MILAGGGAYYLAKRSINEDRQARFDKEQRRRRMTSSLEHSSADSAPRGSSADPHNTSRVSSNVSGNPGRDASDRNALGNERRVTEKSKYEASEPFRSKKGDRFS
ncbi:MAG: hypothetical protein M1813_003607 [Trichoglossum hirsutum]|nr:MAG: hypothetical protein M1813_003607 [Trichoglossum hirsutum]